MHRHIRLICVFLCSIILCVQTSLSISDNNGTVIDVSNSSDGYFTINYFEDTSSKMKVKIAYNNEYGNKVVYYDYTVNESSSYAFIYGNGIYKISLCRNSYGTIYSIVTSKEVNVVLDNSLSPYLISTKEIEFTEDDKVSEKASEICKWYFTPLGKACAIHSYVYKNIIYDEDIACDVKNKIITTRNPKAIDVLTNKKGVCYDKAVLFAAMCRSQGIPCKIVKGYYNDIYHAWNKIYVNNKWMDIDPSTTIDFIIKNGKRYKEKI